MGTKKHHALSAGDYLSYVTRKPRET